MASCFFAISAMRAELCCSSKACALETELLLKRTLAAWTWSFSLSTAACASACLRYAVSFALLASCALVLVLATSALNEPCAQVLLSRLAAARKSSRLL